MVLYLTKGNTSTTGGKDLNKENQRIHKNRLSDNNFYITDLVQDILKKNNEPVL